MDDLNSHRAREITFLNSRIKTPMVQTSFKLAIAFLTFQLLSSSCKEDEPFVYECHDGSVKFELFNNELNPQAYLNKLGATKVGYVIIQDENEMYEKLHITFLRKDIDFKNKSLIVVSVNDGAMAYVDSQNIQADCEKQKLTITADLKYGSHPVDGTSYVFAVVPKIPSNTIINFIPNYIN